MRTGTLGALLAGTVVVGCFVIASEMDYQDQLVLREARYERCLHSMGATTDYEVQMVVELCAARTGRPLTENDYP